MRVCLWLNSMVLFRFAYMCVRIEIYFLIYLLFQRIAIIRCTCIKDMERISRMRLVDPKFLTTALWSILRGDLYYVLHCVILFLFFFFSPFSIVITSLGEEKANLSAFRTFVRFVIVWICRLLLPLCVWEGLRFVIVALPGLFSYPFLIVLTWKICFSNALMLCMEVWYL